MKHVRRIAALLGLGALVTVLLGPPRALAQEEAYKSLSIGITTTAGGAVSAPVMVSIIKDGDVVAQSEVSNGGHHLDWRLPPGVYDVRCEGDGMVTLVKRGIHVFSTQDTSIAAPMSQGKGVHIVEYAIGGLSREEVAARLAKLEAAVARLEK